MVPVTALRRHPGTRRREYRQGPVGSLGPGGALSVTESRVPDGSEVSADIVLDAVSGGIAVAGQVRAPWEGECRRCLGPVAGEVVAHVRELYRPAEPGFRGLPGEADEETYPLAGDHLDLTPLVRDAVLLALPIAPLCRPDCAGLCCTCGADRNEAPCDCASAADPRWAALDPLRPPPA